MKAAGRPMALIDWKKVDTLLKAQCSTESIATELAVNVKTLRTACMRDNKVNFSLYSQQKREGGKNLLRAKQYDVAMKGNVAMLIFLGKQYLEQSEKVLNDFGMDNGSIKFEFVNGRKEANTTSEQDS